MPDMFSVLLVFFSAFVAADVFFSAAVIYHLLHYTLPGWTAPKIVIPIYGALALVFLGLALVSLLRIPF